MPSSPEDILPIIDLGSFTLNNYQGATKEQVLKQLRHGCETLGCFYLKNHGVEPKLIKDTISDLRSFYSQPLDYKLRFINPEGGKTTGYLKFESQNVNAFMGRKGLPGDPMESYQVIPTESDLGDVDQWPDQPSTFKLNISKYYNALKELSEILMNILSKALNIPGYDDFFHQNCCKASHKLRTNFFPPDSRVKQMQADQLAAHTDTSVFAILITDECPGALHMFNEATGKWVPVHPQEDMLIMNLGDAMSHWTNGNWKTPLHKVVWPGTKGKIGRMSVAFFCNPNKDSILESIPILLKNGEKAKYESMTFENYIRMKMEALTKV